MQDERDIIEKAKKGNSKAVGRLYETYRSKGIAIAKQHVQVYEDAEDIFQDAFLKAMGTLDSFDETKRFQPWLDVIIVNTCKDFLRKKRPLRFSEPDPKGDPGEDPGVFPGDIPDTDRDVMPEEVIGRKAVKEIMDEVLDGLPPQQREAVVYYYYREMNIKEIAEMTGLPENTVKSNLNYARKKVKSGVETYQKKHDTRLYSSPLAAAVLVLYFHTPEGAVFAGSVLGGAGAGAAGVGATATGAGAAGTTGAGAAATGSAVTGATATASVAAAGAVAGAATTGFGAAKIAAIIFGVVAIGGGATFGGIKIAQTVRENRAAETAVTAEAAQGVTEAELLAAEEGVSVETPPEITETAETPEIPEAPTETADTTQLTAAVNEALEAGNFEAAETLLTEAAETGAYPEDALHQLRAETAVQHISNDEEMQSKITAVGKGLAVLQKAQEAGVINEDWWEDGHIQEILYCAFFTMDAPSYRQMEAHDEVEVDMEEARILIEEVAGLEFVPENLPSAPISGEGGGHAYYSGGKLYATWGHTGGGSAGIYKGVQYDAASGEIRVSGIDDEGYSEGGYATPFTMTMAPADNPFGVTVTGVEVGEGYEYGPGEEP